MKTCSNWRIGLASLAGVAALVAAGCATAPRAERFAEVAAGTVLTFQVRQSGSYGSGEVRSTVTVGHTDWRGTPAITFARPQSSTDVQDRVTHKLLAVLNPSGQPAVTYEPPIGYEFPFEVGKSWVIRSRAVRADGQVQAVEYRYTIEAFEDVNVPAGNFKAWRILIIDQAGEQQRMWASTDAGLALKRSFVRPPMHPQGAGTREVELTARMAPK